MPLTGGGEGAGAEQGTRRRPGTAAESGGRGQRSAAARQSGHDGVTPSSSSALLRRAPLPPAAAHRAARRPRPAELPALPLPLALPPLLCGGLKCIRGERDCNFTSPLSSKAVCLPCLARLLERLLRVNSGDWKGKMRLPTVVGLSLTDPSKGGRRDPCVAYANPLSRCIPCPKQEQGTRVQIARDFIFSSSGSSTGSS